MTRMAPDTVVDGRYQIVERLGAGGMAEVFLAQDMQLGRQVALKLLYRRFAEDADFVERFRREASAAAGLQHPNVVSVYDRGEWDGTYYIAMEYLDGRSLKEIVAERGPLPPEEAVDATLGVLRAARFAHRRGIIHRDLKPHNVLVDPEGRVKVTDFGIARAGASDMTETGSIMGTAQYLSPEQAQGHAVTERSDLYAIGVLLYELLTGRVPFDGEAAVTIALKQVQEEPVPPGQVNAAVPPALEAVVLRALEKDPARRFADADEFIAALEAARGGTALPAAVVYDELVEEPPPLRGWVWALLLVLVVAGIVIAALLLAGGGERVRVPSVVGAGVSAATERLQRDGFEVESVRDTSRRERNTVIAQSPRGGRRVEEGATVRVTVSDGPGTRSVPDVTGDGRQAALRELSRAGFRVRERRRSSDDVPENRVIETRPAAGQQVDAGASVTLVVSTGPPRVAVPDVVGDSEEDARSALEGAGFSVARDEREDADADPGTVLRQSPAGGARARRGAEVTILVAVEPSTVAVPDLVGQSVEDATRALADADLEAVVRQVDVDTPDEDGQVVSQRPSAGREVEPGSSVELRVGRFDPALNPDPDTQTGEEQAPTDTGTGAEPPPTDTSTTP